MNRTPFAVAAALFLLLGSACEPATQAPPAAPDPGGPCQPADCGPIAEIARVCNDQSVGATQCARADDGVCRWRHVCPEDRAGPAPAAGTPLPGPAQVAAPPQGGAPAAAPRAFTEANAQLAQALYGRLGAQVRGNFFFSPASVSTALALAYAGARGETAAQMARTMRFTLPQAELHAAFAAQTAKLTSAGKGPVVRIANRVWAQAGLPVEGDFLGVAKGPYGAGLELANFNGAPEPARGAINKWVEDQTSGKIKDLLPQGSVTPLTRLVITNAIYFKAQWATPFDKAETASLPFSLGGGAKADAPMMHRLVQAGFAEAGDAQVLELPYDAAGSGRNLSMVVILPKAVDGLGAVERRIAAGDLRAYLGGIAEERVDVTLPRFKMTSEHDLGSTLAAMGMPLAFDAVNADFSGISKAEPLYITRIAHKAFVEVNEEGTEAAAATGVVIGTRSMPPPPKVFRADHPFAFLIRDRDTGAVLFMGRVADPR